MKRELFLIIFLMCVSFVSSSCEDGQIDINIASQEELEELYLVGPVKAQAIIDSRPFDSIDELVEIYGIGEKTVEGIIEQGLGCVDGAPKEGVHQGGASPSDEGKVVREQVKELVEEENEEKDEKEIEIINLTTQTIKSPENNENKSRYAMYGFAGFCVLLGILFMLKKKKYKNEFR